MCGWRETLPDGGGRAERLKKETKEVKQQREREAKHLLEQNMLFQSHR